MIINAEGLVAGRLASRVAKEMINNKTVIIINAEKAIVVGKESAVLPKYKQRVDASVKTNPHKGPKYDRVPEKMLRRMIKGMLPNRKKTAERIMKQLKVYNNVPKEINESEAQTIEGIKCNEKHAFMYLGDLAKKIGGKW